MKKMKNTTKMNEMSAESVMAAYAKCDEYNFISYYLGRMKEVSGSGIRTFEDALRDMELCPFDWRRVLAEFREAEATLSGVELEAAARRILWRPYRSTKTLPSDRLLTVWRTADIMRYKALTIPSLLKEAGKVNDASQKELDRRSC